MVYSLKGDRLEWPVAGNQYKFVFTFFNIGYYSGPQWLSSLE